MAHLPPSAVFGTSYLGQAVHVLLLIENSLPMVEHREDLQHHILPCLLGAVRVANPGGNVQIFWETTGKTQEQRTTQKQQRHFNDFPEIDIVGLPQNKLSPLFVRQSVDLFLLNDATSTDPPAARHLVIVAMSNPADDNAGPSDNVLASGTDTQVTWDSVARKLHNNNIVVHIVANPAARMSRIFDLFRKTLRSQTRQEVIPWHFSDNSRCICHFSGAAMTSKDNGRSAPQDEWPEVSPTANDPYDLAATSTYQSQYPPNALPTTYATPPAFPTDPLTINHSHNHPACQHAYDETVALIDPSTNEPLTVGGPVSLVSRMQAMHGLAKRRPERERARTALTSFFREPEPPRPNGSPGGGVERTERVRPHRNLATSPLGVRPNLSPTGSSDGKLPGQVGSRAVSGAGPSSPERRGGRRARTTSRSSTTSTASSSATLNLPPSSPSSDGSSGSTPSPMWPPPGTTAASAQSNLSYPASSAGYSSSVNANAIPLTEIGRRYTTNVPSTGNEYEMGMNVNMVVPSQQQGSHRYSFTSGIRPIATHPSYSMPNAHLTSSTYTGGSTSMSVPSTPIVASGSAGAWAIGTIPVYQQSTTTVSPLSTPSAYPAPMSAPAMANNNLSYFTLPYNPTNTMDAHSAAAPIPPPGATQTAMNLRLPMPLATTLPVSESGELEVVPASAPLDPAGEVPFIIDEEAEKRAEIKLERALQAMREEAQAKKAASAASLTRSSILNAYPTVKAGGSIAMSEAGSLSPTRTQASSSSSFLLPNSPITRIPPTYDPETQAYVELSYTSAS